jgi:hypothetical protein
MTEMKQRLAEVVSVMIIPSNEAPLHDQYPL